jgi:hypothetical protein
MRSFADNSQERQSRAIANAPGEQSRKGTYMVDNRPEMAVQRKMVEMARKYGEQKALQQKQMFTRKEAVQKKGPEDEDELQFKAKDSVQLKGPEDEDELQFKSKEAVQKKGPEDEDELQFKAKDAVQLKGPEDEDELQFKAEEPVQKQENKTGLPDDLKAGVENLSGMAMDDVRVHYNSGKPAQLNAYAYTQGSEIHVAPGQEKHLPHEAWHVVQQKQGRVQPTMQMAGGVAVNDDKGLEEEADGMGEQARQEIAHTKIRPNPPKASNAGAQRREVRAPVQLAVSNSATYPPSHVASIHINTLNGMIPAAYRQAQVNLINPPGGVHTPHQAVFLNKPIAMNWGYCVEEQLNAMAVGNGWRTQYVLSNSRPDYERELVPNTHLFVDLTSVTQAGVGGNHITNKLQVSKKPVGDTWEAADITHNGLPGGVPPLLRTNGTVSPLHMKRFQAFKKYCTSSKGSFSPKKNDMRRRYRTVSHATFTQEWNSIMRTKFSNAARMAGFN